MSGIVFLDGLNCLYFIRINNCKVIEMKNDFHKCAELFIYYVIDFNLSLSLICLLLILQGYICLQQMERE